MKILLAILLVLLSFPVQADEVFDRVMESGKIRCGYFQWPPFLTVEPNSGKIQGISYDYVMTLGKELNLDIEWTEEVGVGDYIAGLNANRYDMMCATVWPDSGRMKNSLVTNPIFYSAVYAVVREDDKRFNRELKSIDNESVKIAVIDGDVSASIARNLFGKATTYNLPQVSDQSHQFQSLITKKADVTFMDSGTFSDFDKRNSGKLVLLDSHGPVQVFPEVFAVRNDALRLKMLIDSAINIMDSNKFYYPLLKEISSSFPPSKPYEVSE